MSANGKIVSGVTEKVLTHEVGAGAPCLKCGDKCPGLDLHFWRKICRNCKCKQEDHDVLTSVSTRGIDNIGKLLMQDQDVQPEPTVKSTSPKKSTSPTKNADKQHKPPVAAPATAPKPNRVTTTAVHQIPNTDQGLNVTIDIGGKKHTLDFGTNDKVDNSLPSPPNDFPPPPPASEDHAFPAPPPMGNSELPPMVPPLPEEFQTKAVLTEKQQSPVKQATPPQSQSPQKNAHPAGNVAVLTTYSNSSSPTKSVGKARKSSTSSSDDGEVEYEWTPPASDPKLIDSYVRALPKDKQPIVGTAEAKHRKKQLMRQLPSHDQEPSECHDLTEQETKEMSLFVKQYREKALGVAKIEENPKLKSCAECRNPLDEGDVVVWAERTGNERYWHPACFSCTECKELLVDLIYFYHDDKIYCGRHYCELHKPRCAACDELIFAPEYTQAEDCYWHLKHFCCWHCDQPLGGKNYVPHDNQPVCIPCYEKSFAHTCSTCNEIIAPNTEWVTFEEHHWHAHSDCFKCSQCSQSLVGKPCIPKGSMVFCCSKCKREKLPPAQ
ncbi:testin [Ciona intestinalis]